MKTSSLVIGFTALLTPITASAQSRLVKDPRSCDALQQEMYACSLDELPASIDAYLDAGCSDSDAWVPLLCELREGLASGELGEEEADFIAEGIAVMLLGSSYDATVGIILIGNGGDCHKQCDAQGDCWWVCGDGSDVSGGITIWIVDDGGECRIVYCDANGCVYQCGGWD